MGLGIAIAVNGSPDPELVQATRVEVYESMGETTTYRIHYEVDISEGDLPLLTDYRLDSGSDLSILIPVEDEAHCLVKGPVQGQSIHLAHGGAGSTLEVQGSDTTIVMDREAKSAVWAEITDSDAVTSILGTYGLTSDVESTSASHTEAKHALVQRESDLSFVRRLARRNGCLFWITCDQSGNETAHFRRPQLNGGVDAELVINLDQPSILSLDITWNAEHPTSVETVQLDLNTLSDIEAGATGTPQNILGEKGLQSITGDTRSVYLAAPADDGGDLRSRGEGLLIESDWFLRATCKTDLETLGRLVRAHTVINLKGAGGRYSGRYFVAEVRHVIDASSHQMEIEMVRNGWEG